MTRKQRRHQQKLEQKRRERERRAAEKLAREIAAAEAARLAAAEAERKHELLAPAVLRDAVLTADGRMLRGPVVRIIAGRPMIGRDFPFLPLRSRRAALELRRDWQDVGAGVGPRAVDYLAAGRGGEPRYSDEDLRMIGQIAMRHRLEAARVCLGPAAGAVGRVVLGCVPIPIWAAEANAARERDNVPAMTGEEAVRFIADALRRLADFYWPPKREALENRGILTIGPSRAAYQVAVEAAGEALDEHGRPIDA